MTEPKVIPIRETRMGAKTIPIPLAPTIRVKLLWGNTHGEAVVRGEGEYLLLDISNRGVHRCRVIRRLADGREEILATQRPSRFCRVCAAYADEIERFFVRGDLDGE